MSPGFSTIKDGKQNKLVILTASLRLRSCSLSFCLSRSLSFALSCEGVGVAGGWELGGPAGVAS